MWSLSPCDQATPTMMREFENWFLPSIFSPLLDGEEEGEGPPPPPPPPPPPEVEEEEEEESVSLIVTVFFSSF